MKLKIKKQLLENEKVSYASDHIDLPEGGVDCSEGCNPYGFPAECVDVFRNFDPAKLGPYPHSQALYNAIIELWKDQCNVERENILLTDGSIEALYKINNIFDTHSATVLGVSPQFTDYYMHAQMLGLNYEPYQLSRKNNYHFDADEFMSLLYQESEGGEMLAPTRRNYNFIYIDNPNNPTGQCIDIRDIERITAEAEVNGITVIIDEAYGDFMELSNSAVQLLEKYHNLVVVRTLSKGYGLAGMRVGYIIGDKTLIHCMNKMSNPYSVGEFGREIAAEALRHIEHVENSKRDFAIMKKSLREALGCTEETPAGSGRLHMSENLDTNSLFLVYHDDPAINLKKEFWTRGVLVVDGNDFKGLDSSSARIRLPRMEEFPKLLEAMREINEL